MVAAALAAEQAALTQTPATKLCPALMVPTAAADSKVRAQRLTLLPTDLLNSVPVGARLGALTTLAMCGITQPVVRAAAVTMDTFTAPAEMGRLTPVVVAVAVTGVLDLAALVLSLFVTQDNKEGCA